MVVKYHEYWDLVGVEQHSQFESKLKDLLFKPKERKKFYDKLLKVKNDMSTDTFKEYFELYAAERKTNQQDFTPDSIARLLTKLTKANKNVEDGFNAYDPAAGTGTLLIAQWNYDRVQVMPWNYYPHNYFYMAEELSDTAIIYLLHNLALRGMNAVVLHGDSIERKYKQVYFVQNCKDDHMLYSDINVMPHSEFLKKALNVREWAEEPIKHIESQKVVWRGFDKKVSELEQTSLFEE